MIAVENGTEIINSQRLFVHLSNEQLKYLGSKLTKKDLLFGKRIQFEQFKEDNNLDF